MHFADVFESGWYAAYNGFPDETGSIQERKTPKTGRRLKGERYSMKRTVSIFLVLMILCSVCAAGAEWFYIRENIRWGMSNAKV